MFIVGTCISIDSDIGLGMALTRLHRDVSR